MLQGALHFCIALVSDFTLPWWRWQTTWKNTLCLNIQMKLLKSNFWFNGNACFIGSECCIDFETILALIDCESFIIMSEPEKETLAKQMIKWDFSVFYNLKLLHSSVSNYVRIHSRLQCVVNETSIGSQLLFNIIRKLCFNFKNVSTSKLFWTRPPFRYDYFWY